MFLDKIHEEEAIAKETEESKNWLLKDNRNEYVTETLEALHIVALNGYTIHRLSISCRHTSQHSCNN